MMARHMIMIAGMLALAAFSAPPAVAEAPAEPAYGDLTVVPDEFLGAWKMTSRKCEEREEGEAPDTRPVENATIRFDRDFTYELEVEGWRSVGSYHVQRMRASPLSIELHDTLYSFDLVDGHLENWGEGDAVYLCARVFERANG